MSDLVKRMRATESEFMAAVADRIEALEGEVNELKNWKQDFEPELAKAEADAEKWRADWRTQNKLLTAADARAERLRVFVAHVAKQPTVEEMEHEAAEADFEGGWTSIVLDARKALEDEKQ